MKNTKLIDDISILIAEDEAELREYLQEYLELFFKKVFVAKCGVQGFQLYLDKSPDIIISDINMPNLDGLSMIKRIRETDKEIDIIIMSAYSEREKLLTAIELGLVTYLIKPINSQKLKDVLLDVVKKIRDTKKRINLVENVFWDIGSSTLWQDNTQLPLREKEAMLLKLLCSKTKQAFTSKDIFNYIYADQDDKVFSQYSITSFIKRLRTKLPDKLIQNVYGSGYKVATRD